MYSKTDFIDEHRNIQYNHTIHSTQFPLYVWSNATLREKMFNDDAETDYTILLVLLCIILDVKKKYGKQNSQTKKNHGNLTIFQPVCMFIESFFEFFTVIWAGCRWTFLRSLLCRFNWMKNIIFLSSFFLQDLLIFFSLQNSNGKSNAWLSCIIRCKRTKHNGQHSRKQKPFI